MKRILIIDDHEIVRDGLKNILIEQPEACTFGERQPLRILDQVLRDVVQPFDRNQVHSAEIGNVQAMLARQILAKVFGIDFHRAQPLKKSEAKKPAYGRAASEIV